MKNAQTEAVVGSATQKLLILFRLPAKTGNIDPKEKAGFYTPAFGTLEKFI